MMSYETKETIQLRFYLPEPAAMIYRRMEPEQRLRIANIVRDWSRHWMQTLVMKERARPQKKKRRS